MTRSSLSLTGNVEGKARGSGEMAFGVWRC